MLFNEILFFLQVAHQKPWNCKGIIWVEMLDIETPNIFIMPNNINDVIILNCEVNISVEMFYMRPPIYL